MTPFEAGQESAVDVLAADVVDVVVEPVAVVLVVLVVVTLFVDKVLFKTAPQTTLFVVPVPMRLCV